MFDLDRTITIGTLLAISLGWIVVDIFLVFHYNNKGDRKKSVERASSMKGVFFFVFYIVLCTYFIR